MNELLCTIIPLLHLPSSRALVASCKDLVTDQNKTVLPKFGTIKVFQFSFEPVREIFWKNRALGILDFETFNFLCNLMKFLYCVKVSMKLPYFLVACRAEHLCKSNLRLHKLCYSHGYFMSISLSVLSWVVFPTELIQVFPFVVGWQVSFVV